MHYRGKYPIFDTSRIRTYPLETRRNKVTLDELLRPADIEKFAVDLPRRTQDDIAAVAEAVVSARRAGKPVVAFTGAHLVKNGLGPLLAELVVRRVVTLVAGNAATAIHDFELALIGQTSENVPQALGKGAFGMAREFGYINAAVALGHEQGLGFGEALGRAICEPAFFELVLARVAPDDRPRAFEHPEVSLVASCYRNGVPFTVHAGIGTDVTDQHPSLDGAAKGACSARDFLIFAEQIANLAGGGVVVNVGSAVAGPEVLLKAVSMAANVGRAPAGIVTAVFDLRRYQPEAMSDESAEGYYFRDLKSIVTRIPKAFAGRGFYIRGNQKQTFPLFCKMIVQRL